MIASSIGTKRFFILLVLGGCFAALSLYAYAIIGPQEKAKTAERDASFAEVAQTRADVEKMRSDLITFETQKQLFEKLSKIGFLNDQNRVLTRARFETLQRLSKIVSAKYEIKAAKITENELSENTGYVTMQSPISVSISAIDDLDVYRFIYYLNYGFPGHIKIMNLKIERLGSITPEVLKQIGAGQPPQIISAVMELEWTTMAKKDSIPPEVLGDVNGTGGGAQ